MTLVNENQRGWLRVEHVTSANENQRGRFRGGACDPERLVGGEACCTFYDPNQIALLSFTNLFLLP